jgi:hypothetical protein
LPRKIKVDDPDDLTLAAGAGLFPPVDERFQEEVEILAQEFRNIVHAVFDFSPWSRVPNKGIRVPYLFQSEPARGSIAAVHQLFPLDTTTTAATSCVLNSLHTPYYMVHTMSRP